MTSKNFRKHTIIQGADKGSAVVALTLDAYLTEANRHVQNQKHYRHLGTQSLMTENQTLIQQQIQTLQDEGYLSQKQVEYLTQPTEPRPRLLYLLPKIHKSPDQWPIPHQIPPCRPIISDVSSESYHLSEYLDSFLQPIASQHPSYLKDTYDFLNKLSQIQVTQDTLLVTADVDSMYTNISHEAGLRAVRAALTRNPNPARPPIDTFLELLSLTLTRNDFYFNGEFYLQTCGTAMGKRYAPSYANIFMAEWERSISPHTPAQQLFYGRFLDDIKILWEGTQQSLQEYLHILNTDHPCITLKAEISTSSVNFLDVTVFKDENTIRTGYLSTKVYHKPTDTLQLLHHLSFHPPHTFPGIVKSQVLRFHRLSTNKSDFQQSCNNLFQVLTQRGYTYQELRKIYRHTLTAIENNQTQTLRPPRNIPLPEPVLPNHSPSSGIAHPCRHPRCALCNHVPTTTTYTSSTTGQTYPLHGETTCQSTGVIYLVTCLTCSHQYVGLTRNQLNHRFWNHRYAITTQKDTALSNHLNEHLDPWAFTVIPIAQPKTNPQQDLTTLLPALESFFIKLLGTLEPQGLNVQEQLDRPILPVVIPYSHQATQWTGHIKATWDSFFRQEHPTTLPHRPIAAYALGAKPLGKQLTSANIRDRITIQLPSGKTAQWTQAEPRPQPSYKVEPDIFDHRRFITSPLTWEETR